MSVAYHPLPQINISTPPIKLKIDEKDKSKEATKRRCSGLIVVIAYTLAFFRIVQRARQAGFVGSEMSQRWYDLPNARIRE